MQYEGLAGGKGISRARGMMTGGTCFMVRKQPPSLTQQYECISKCSKSPEFVSSAARPLHGDAG